jgi:aspartyl-tRNA synthetase
MAMGKLRKKLGASMGLAKPDHYKFVWVDEFPLFELTDEGKPTSAHHPFTAPNPKTFICWKQTR